MAKQLKEEIRAKASARLVIECTTNARYEAVSNRFASAKATEELLNEIDDIEMDDMRLFEDMFVNDHF
eukprot:gene14783-16320_t